ncbi:MAG: hypothetical protein M0Z81_04375 [Deltaproteobacteria bacterium]|jgi:hypothetical protein|nr:hypothetical protein [Deltaproteobacteria bacterium]
MPEKCRVVVCGFDPMLVKAYAAANARACWWHVSDELYNEFQMKPKSKVQGKLVKVYAGKTGQAEATPDEPFEWECSHESGLAVLIPSEVIKKYKLTEFHFLELSIEKIDGKDVYPGQEKLSKKWWPDDRMKLSYTLEYIG